MVRFDKPNRWEDIKGSEKTLANLVAEYLNGQSSESEESPVRWESEHHGEDIKPKLISDGMYTLVDG